MQPTRQFGGLALSAISGQAVTSSTTLSPTFKEQTVDSPANGKQKNTDQH
jgi:hypothetical protein